MYLHEFCWIFDCRDQDQYKHVKNTEVWRSPTCGPGRPASGQAARPHTRPPGPTPGRPAWHWTQTDPSSSCIRNVDMATWLQGGIHTSRMQYTGRRHLIDPCTWIDEVSDPGHSHPAAKEETQEKINGGWRNTCITAITAIQPTWGVKMHPWMKRGGGSNDPPGRPAW